MIVMKFGGTSNEDASAMTNVIEIVRAHTSERPVVVISAIARGTNELERTARTASLGNAGEAERIVDALFARHDQILAQLLKTAARLGELREVFATYRAELKRIITGLSILRELTPRTMDAVCSYGERLSSRIIAAGLQEGGTDAAWVDAKEFMLTDANFGCALPQMERVKERLALTVLPLIRAGKVPVTQGFIGVTENGDATTMGRESSDYSASIIGAALDAEKVQIWTDVDGILTADPTVVKEVRKLKRMSFEEAFELSYFGAKVLHPNTMIPVLEKGIPVQILNSKWRQGSGTIVDREPDPGGAGVLKSIAYKKGVTVVAVAPRKRYSQNLFWNEIFNVLTRHGISTPAMATSEYSVAFAVDDQADVADLKRRLEEVGSVQVIAGMGSVCLVGRGMRNAPGLMKKIFSALSDVEVMLISFGASDLNLTLVVHEAQMSDVVNRLHAELFENTARAEIFDARRA